jgi:4-amino-4-deoxy-L-arabinose transferase-like glycosyltransferase
MADREPRSSTSRTWLLLIALAAFAHACAYIYYQRTDWMTSWMDQEGYRHLGEALARTGRFTRYPDAPTYVPEVLRTPGYPAFVATMYRLFGVSQLAVAIPQAVVFGLLTFIVYLLVRRLSSERAAVMSALAVALYAPIPYYGALVLTEFWTTFVLTVAISLVIRALQRGRLCDYLLAGLMLGFTALCRPIFALLPIVVTAVGAATAFRGSFRLIARWAVLLGAATATGFPWLLYNYHYFHRLTISPAGGIGRSTWEASWQGVWPGRVQARLIDMAEHDPDRATLDRDVTGFARQSGFEATAMLTYLHQWEDIRRIWTTPTDPQERARKRIEADEEYWRVALQNIDADRLGWLKRRATRGLFMLWAADTPIRYSDINDTPVALVRGIWLAQLAIDLAALVGLGVLVSFHRWREAALLATPLVYLTVVHFPFSTETRLSLPGKPTVIALAVIAAAWLLQPKAAAIDASTQRSGFVT